MLWGGAFLSRYVIEWFILYSISIFSGLDCYPLVDPICTIESQGNFNIKKSYFVVGMCNILLGNKETKFWKCWNHCMWSTKSTAPYSFMVIRTLFPKKGRIFLHWYKVLSHIVIVTRKLCFENVEFIGFEIWKYCPFF